MLFESPFEGTGLTHKIPIGERVLRQSQKNIALAGNAYHQGQRDEINARKTLAWESTDAIDPRGWGKRYRTIVALGNRADAGNANC